MDMDTHPIGGLRALFVGASAGAGLRLYRGASSWHDVARDGAVCAC